MEKLAEAGELPIEVRMGVELGEGHRDPALAAELAADPRLDFVLGSLHMLPGYGDFYWQHYSTHAQCEKMFDLYLDELQHIESGGVDDELLATIQLITKTLDGMKGEDT